MNDKEKAMYQFTHDLLELGTSNLDVIGKQYIGEEMLAQGAMFIFLCGFSKEQTLDILTRYTKMGQERALEIQKEVENDQG